MERRSGLSSVRREFAKVERELGKLIQAIKDGVSGVTIKNELQAREVRQAELRQQAQEPEPPPLLHPSMSDVYREKVNGLCRALEVDEHNRVSAGEALRGLIDEITLTPANGQLEITLKGNLAGMLRMAAQNGKRPSEPTTSLAKYSWLRGGDLNPRPL